MRSIRVLFFIFMLFHLSFGLLRPTLADMNHEGDLILSGNDVFVIENTTYTETGNIIVRHNARLTMRNATLIFNVRYHEEFAIIVENNATFEVLDSNFKIGILPGEVILVEIYDEALIVVINSDLKTEAKGNLSFGNAHAYPGYRGSTIISNSKVNSVSIMFSSFGGSNISISESHLHNLTFRFEEYEGEFSDLRPGFFSYWNYRQGAYDITLEDTTVSGN